jgi:hypothetical protein
MSVIDELIIMESRWHDTGSKNAKYSENKLSQYNIFFYHKFNTDWSGNWTRICSAQCKEPLKLSRQNFGSTKSNVQISSLLAVKVSGVWQVWGLLKVRVNKELHHWASADYRQLPTNAQTTNKGINQPFIIIKTLHMFRLARSHHQGLEWCLSNVVLGLLMTLVMLLHCLFRWS